MTKQQNSRLLDENGFAHEWIPPYSNDKELLRARVNFFQNKNNTTTKYIASTYNDFISSFEQSLAKHQFVTVNGLDLFKQKDVIIGCQHFIDQLIMTHGLDNLQLFEGGYNYYKRLDPKLKYVTVDTMEPGKPLILEHPFPRFGDSHVNYNEIISKANKTGIDVYLDCAWLPTAWGIDLDLTEPCIKGVCMSLSKPLGLHWSRIGVRWLKEHTYDTIAIENEFLMVSFPNIMTGMYYLDKFPMDYLVKKYKNTYYELCDKQKLTPTKNIMTATIKKTNKMVGVAHALLNKNDQEN